MLHRESVGHNVLEIVYVEDQSVVEIAWAKTIICRSPRFVAERAVSCEVRSHFLEVSFAVVFCLFERLQRRVESRTAGEG